MKRDVHNNKRRTQDEKYTNMERGKKLTVRSQNSKKEYEKNQLISSADFLVALMKKMITLIQKLT